MHQDRPALKPGALESDAFSVRLVATNRIEEGAELGRDVLTGRSDGIPLLRAGSRISGRYRDALQRAGINAVYVKDDLSEGIEPKPAISDETRAVATRAVAATFESAKEALAAGQPLQPEAVAALEGVVAQIAADIRSSGEVALALSDLSAATATRSSTRSTSPRSAADRRSSVPRARLGRLRGRRTWAGVDQRLSKLGLGLLVHDIGKLVVRSRCSTSRRARRARVEGHEEPSGGRRRAAEERPDQPLAKVIVRSHHERWDGSGYPDRKAGEDIHELARIAAVADVYDAITSARVYAAAKPAYVASTSSPRAPARRSTPRW